MPAELALRHKLIQRIRPDVTSEVLLDDLYGRAAWTFLAEPGDSVANAMIAVFGADAALMLAIEHATPASIHEQIDADGYDHGVTVEEVERAVTGWRRLSHVDVAAGLALAAEHGISLIVPNDALWPRGLSQLGARAPYALWRRGRDEAIARLDLSIAVVGARAATSYGELITRELAEGLGSKRVTVVSSGAYGIPGAAHRGALSVAGLTVAVLAIGLDRVYPAGHAQLLGDVAQHGALLSELPPGHAPTQWRNQQRGRLIAAMSTATVLMEAGQRSGSLAVAATARELGRPVGAYPHPVTSALQRGGHDLIKYSGAALCTNVTDVLTMVGAR